MSNAIFTPPTPVNEPVLNYGKGSPERAALKAAIKEMKSKEVDIPMWIGGKDVRTGNTHALKSPHELSHKVGVYHEGDATHVRQAIDAAMKAKPEWEAMPFESRAAIFLKAADLLAGPFRYKINAATMIGQSKNAYQAEIDSACELIDFLRFNVHFAHEIYKQQPLSVRGVWNRMEYRPLEGFVLAITPFNFTAIAGNLPTSPALMGNTVVWKPAHTQLLSAYVIVEVLREAGLPDGVINLVVASGPITGEVCFSHRDFGGVHFTGSTGVFNQMWKSIGANVGGYRSYPRIVGETGGKDFVMVHKSADVDTVVTALARGAFEYQGQKCSAASRAYVPSNLWNAVRDKMVTEIETFKMGSVEDHANFVNAVIDEKSFTKINQYIQRAKTDGQKVLTGGIGDMTQGYFIPPTVLQVDKPDYVTMCEEIFGPVLSVYVYDESKFEETMDVLDAASPYALTGSIISQDRRAIDIATVRLRQTAGNFYINDKPTGAVVGQQPFGGARASGTNDKAGSALNLLRWTSARSIKETLVPPKDYRYPFLEV